jgi:hypothetical protein
MTAASGHRLAQLLGGAVLAAWAGLMTVSLRQAQLAEQAHGLVLAAFPPGMPAEQAFEAVLRAGGEPVRPTWLGFVWVARGREAGFVGRLKEAGALAAFGDIPLGPVLGGCAAVSGDADRMTMPALAAGVPAPH